MHIGHSVHNQQGRVYIYRCTHTHTDTHTHTHTHIHIYTYIHIHIYIHIHACMHAIYLFFHDFATIRACHILIQINQTDVLFDIFDVKDVQVNAISDP